MHVNQLKCYHNIICNYALRHNYQLSIGLAAHPVLLSQGSDDARGNFHQIGNVSI